MIYRRVKVREDYFCQSTQRMQAKSFIFYHILNPSGEVQEVIEAKKWLGFRRKYKIESRASKRRSHENQKEES